MPYFFQELKHVKIFSHDYNDEIGNGETFDDWGSMENRWGRYANQAFQGNEEGDKEGSEYDEREQRPKVRKGRKRPEYEFHCREDGTPQLPDIGDLPVWKMKDVMRAFVAHHYRK